MENMSQVRNKKAEANRKPGLRRSTARNSTQSKRECPLIRRGVVQSSRGKLAACCFATQNLLTFSKGERGWVGLARALSHQSASTKPSWLCQALTASRCGNSGPAQFLKFCLFRWHPAVLVMLPTLPTAAVSRLTNHLTNMLRGISLRQTIRNQHCKKRIANGQPL